MRSVTDKKLAVTATVIFSYVSCNFTKFMLTYKTEPIKQSKTDKITFNFFITTIKDYSQSASCLPQILNILQLGALLRYMLKSDSPPANQNSKQS